MTTEQKAKAYDEALDRAKKVNKCKANNREPGTSICEYIFPELKEDKNEKIRKDIISYIKSIANNENISPDSKKEFKTWITWLGEQFGQKLIEGIPTATNYDKMF